MNEAKGDFEKAGREVEQTARSILRFSIFSITRSISHGFRRLFQRPGKSEINIEQKIGVSRQNDPRAPYCIPAQRSQSIVQRPMPPPVRPAPANQVMNLLKQPTVKIEEKEKTISQSLLLMEMKPSDFLKVQSSLEGKIKDLHQSVASVRFVISEPDYLSLETKLKNKEIKLDHSLKECVKQKLPLKEKRIEKEKEIRLKMDRNSLKRFSNLIPLEHYKLEKAGEHFIVVLQESKLDKILDLLTAKEKPLSRELSQNLEQRMERRL